MDSSNNSKIIYFLNKARKTLSNFSLFAKYLSGRGLASLASLKLRRSGQVNFDKRLVFSLSKARVPNFKQLKYIKKFLNRQEIWIIGICFAVIIVNLFLLSARFLQAHLQTVPISGGEYTEGLVGAPKYINPLYANVSDVDNDIAGLVFSSLFKHDGNGKLVNDLAEEYKISGDNKIYTFKIRQDVKWHDGSDLTIDDIIFTFNAIKDSQYKSPLRASFGGVEIKKIDEEIMEFTLSEPYAAFLELLTFGILPQNLWQQIPPGAANLAELNLKPVGSGQYKFKSLVKDKSGNIRSYNLVVNDSYYDKEPHIENLNFKFFPGFSEAAAALNEGLVDGISYLPRQIKEEIIAQDHLNYYQLNLPQLTALFFNEQSDSALKDKKTRQALLMAIDKNKIISQILNDEARLADSPILPDSFAYNPEIKKYQYDKETAAKLLDEAGWIAAEITDEDIAKAKDDANSDDENKKKQAEAKLAMGKGKWRSKDNEFLTVDLTTVDNKENNEVAEIIKNFWQELNIKTNVEIIAASQIQNDIIKPRNFTVLLYSIVVGADPDPYVFWHSSQINERGLNITNYSNKEVDQLLEDARLTNDIEVRKEKYKKFQEIIAEDAPAFFLYSPVYTYVQAKKIKGFAVNIILMPRDRFANIADWYVSTGRKIIW
ncbi:peptide ABC transporter substrate-binding protein [Patescibacteria group bacterium]|nr:peptide ABC transporter substrate-binding protein [Patescibacteria group bacterium]